MMVEMMISSLRRVYGIYQAKAGSLSITRDLANSPISIGWDSFMSFNGTHVSEPSFRSTRDFHPQVVFLVRFVPECVLK